MKIKLSLSKILNVVFLTVLFSGAVLGVTRIADTFIRGVTDVNTTNIFVTNIGNDGSNINIEDTLDGTGYSAIGFTWLNGTNTNTTNLYADNLEKNLDATGFSIVDATDLNSTNSFTTNLYATNLEKNLDGTGFSIIGLTDSNSTNSFTDYVFMSTSPSVVTCNAGTEGGQYANVTLHLPCYCNSTDWVQMDDFATPCDDQ